MGSQSATPISSSQPSFQIINNSFWLLFQVVIDIGLAFTFTWFAVRWLGPQGFGILALNQSILNIAGLATLNLEISLIRLVPEFKSQGLEKETTRIYSIILCIKISLAVLTASTLFIIAPWLANFFNIPLLKLALQIGSISLFMAACADFGANAALGLMHPEIRTYVTLTRRTIEVLGILLLVVVEKVDVVMAVTILAIADSVAAIGYLLPTYRYLIHKSQQTKVASSRELINRILNYSMPLWGARLSDVIGREIGKLILGKLSTSEILGYYSVARLVGERLMSLLSQAPLATVSVLAGIVSHSTTSAQALRKISLITSLIKYQIIGGGILGLLVWLFSPLFIFIIGGNTYEPANLAVRLAGMATIFWAATASIHSLVMSFDKTNGIFLMNLCQILFTFIFYLVMVHPLGANGATISDGLAQIITMIFSFYLASSWFHLEKKQLFNIFLQASLPIFLISLPLTTTLHNWILTTLWILLGLFFYVFYLLRYDIIPIKTWENFSKIQLTNASLNSLLHNAISLIQKFHALTKRHII